MIPELLQHLATTWSDQFSAYGIDLQSPLYALKVGADADEDRKLNFFVFQQNEKIPSLIMKIGRSEAAKPRLIHEYRSMKFLTSIDILASQIPRPLGLFEDNTIFLEEYISGAALNTLIHRNKRTTPQAVRHDLSRIYEWLTHFSKFSKKQSYAFLGASEIRDRHERLGMTLPDEFVDELMVQANKYEGISLPLCSSHGDFWPGNVIMHHGGLYIIDWEDYRENTYPYYDAFLFAMTYATVISFSRWSKESDNTRLNRALLLESNWFSLIMIEAFQSYFESMRYPLDATHLFFSLFLFDMAIPSDVHSQGRKKLSRKWQQRLTRYADSYKQSLWYRNP
jgi:hypothetical protein